MILGQIDVFNAMSVRGSLLLDDGGQALIGRGDSPLGLVKALDAGNEKGQYGTNGAAVRLVAIRSVAQGGKDDDDMICSSEEKTTSK